ARVHASSIASRLRPCLRCNCRARFAVALSGVSIEFAVRYLQLELALDRLIVYSPSTNHADLRQHHEIDHPCGTRRDGYVVPAWRRQAVAERRRPSPRWEVCALAR